MTMHDFFRRAGDPHAPWGPDDDAELMERLAVERAIDAAPRTDERLLFVTDDPHDDVDGPRAGSTFVRRVEDRLE